MSGRGCTVDDCDVIHYARGWCRKHYCRWLRHGDPGTMHRAANGEGHLDNRGYRRFKVGGRLVGEHRLVMGLTPGDGKEVHHLDHNKLNNDPANLAVMTPGEHRRLHKKGLI